MNAHHSEPSRVWITGTGAITPSGLNVADTWHAVQHGHSGIGVLEGQEFEGLSVRIGGQVRGFNAEDHVPRHLARRLENFHLWAIAAADQAFEEAADIQTSPSGASSADLPWDPARVMIVTATGSGPIRPQQRAALAYAEDGQRGVPLTLSMHGAPDSPAALISQRYGITGPAHAVSATCASGAVGLGEALRALRHGYADAAIVIGVEDCINPANLASNANMRALASGFNDRPQEASRPFDRDRAGFVMSAGAAAVVLESDAALQRRGGQALAELAGFGSSSDAHHATAPDPEGRGAAAAMRAALADAGLTPEDFATGGPAGAPLGHVNAHGTSTSAGDAAEARALEAVFGDAVSQIPVTAVKSSTGHLLGAGGVLEAIISVCALRDGVIPPTVNLDVPDFPKLDVVAARKPLDRAGPCMSAVLSNSFGFGGHNGSVLIRTV